MSLHNNMTVHCFDPSYSNQDFVNAVQNMDTINVPDGQLGELRMTRASLEGVFPQQINEFSFSCQGVKQHKQSNLVMIEYDMRFQDNINWATARKKFQNFLHRKLNIDKSSVIIEGIVSSDTYTWYIMKDTKALMKALNNISETLKSGGTKWVYIGVVAGAVGLIAFFKYRK